MVVFILFFNHFNTLLICIVSFGDIDKIDYFDLTHTTF